MRDLSVYYCRSCGYYAYYQLPRHAVCPKCETAMQLMDIRYQDFMDLDYEERDRLICQEIIRSSSTLVQRICAPSKLYNQRELTARLTKEVLRLEAENKKLEERWNGCTRPSGTSCAKPKNWSGSWNSCGVRTPENSVQNSSRGRRAPASAPAVSLRTAFGQPFHTRSSGLSEI